jgi:hypothetical protein
MGRWLLLLGLDTGRLGRTHLTGRRDQEIDIVFILTFGWVHGLVLLCFWQLRNF